MALTQVNSEGIKDGEIKDADVNASAAIAGSKLAAATTSAAGSMSAADKTKLDGVATSATANPSAPALTGSTDNTICTVTGANAIQGEATLTYDGTDELEIKPATAIAAALTFDSNRTGAGNHIGRVNAKWNGTDVAKIVFACGDDTTNKDEGVITFRTAAGGGAAVTDKLTIEKDGDVKINNGDLVIGTGDHGINFSAQTSSSATNATTGNETLDHYEEGTWTPVLNGSRTATAQQTAYTRIGNQVFLIGKLKTWSTSTDSTNIEISGLPFTPATNGGTGPTAWHQGGNMGDHPTVVRTATAGYIRFLKSGSGSGAWEWVQYADMHSTATEVYFSVTYTTDA